MKLHNPNAEIFVPDQLSQDNALHRITHLGIGAHQDDLEFMAFHGILNCFACDDQWFGGVTCTHGAGSSRIGSYANVTDAQMMAIRRQEQNAAAVVGGYGVMIQLDYPSSAIKGPMTKNLNDDLTAILTATRPEVVYTHNPADKHETHISVTMSALQAMRQLPLELRPKQVIGCEVWRSLDWLPDEEKFLMDVSGSEKLAAALNGVFDSQIAGGKRYDLAAIGRRSANATFLNPHAADASTQVIFGLDLTPVVVDETKDITSFVCNMIQQFHDDVRHKLSSRPGAV